MGMRIALRRRGGKPASARNMGPGLRLAAALVLTASLGLAVPCRGDGLVIEAPNLTGVAPGSTGSFDLLLVNTNPAGGASFNVAADSFGLSLSGPLSVQFTDVTINTIVPYIYVTSGTTKGGGPLSLDTFPNAQFTASDAEFALPGFRTLNPGDTFGLGHISFAMSPSFTGTATIAFDSLVTSLSDENLNAIPFTLITGSISTVPEPSTQIQAATAALFGAGWLWGHRRRREAAAR